MSRRNTDEDWERERRLDRDSERERLAFRRRVVGLGARTRTALIGVDVVEDANNTTEGES